MRLYLAGPMTRRVAPDLNRSLGHSVVNPAEQTEGRSYADYMREDFEAIHTADAVAVLPLWELGPGSRAEVAVAIAIGVPVLSAVDLTEIYGPDAGVPALRALIGPDGPEPTP